MSRAGGPLPFRVTDQGGLLFLDLDTPGSRVNIITPEASAQLEAVLPRVDPKKTRGVVIRSAKPHSFINGARLLYAASVRTRPRAIRLAREVRRTFTAIGACRVPTIAAIAGSCFGCGLELALWCDHRVASDSFDTELYLTEVADYLLTPVFGATQRLPELVGLENAIELVLWGRRLRGAEALEMGLVDRVIAHRSFDRELEEFLNSGPVRIQRPAHDAKADGEARARARRRIARLPKEAQLVHRSALRLLERASDPRLGVRRREQLELETFARTVTTPASAKAVSYFFVRQTSELAGSDGAPLDLPARFSLQVEESAAAKRLLALLESRPVKGARVGVGRGRSRVTVATREAVGQRAGEGQGGSGSRAQPKAAPDILSSRRIHPVLGIAAPDILSSRRIHPVLGIAAPDILSSRRIHPVLGIAALEARAVALFFPLGLLEDVCELALGRARERPPEGLVPYLGLAGFTVVVTHPGGAPEAKTASERLIAAYLRGATVHAKAERALSRFGFTRLPRELGRRPPGPCPKDPVASTLAELIAESLRCLDEGVLRHRAQAEVLARVLFGFPLHKGSLFQLLEGRGARALEAQVTGCLQEDETGARSLLRARGFVVR